MQYAECMDEVKIYLEENSIDLGREIDDIDDIFELQKIKYLLNNLPSCNDLAIYNKNIKNKINDKNIKNGNNLSPIMNDIINEENILFNENKENKDNKNSYLLVILIIAIIIFLGIVLGIIYMKK